MLDRASVLKVFILMLWLFIVPIFAWSEVDLQTGEYQRQQQDIEQSGENSLQLTRYYRSGQKYQGWFGFGWGSTFETRLVLMPKGRVILQKHGHGQKIWFQASSEKNVIFTQPYPVGYQWDSHVCGCHQLKVTAWGYQHLKDGQVKHDFDHQGRLLRVWDDEKHQVSLHYQVNRIRIEDQQGHYLNLERVHGHVVQVSSHHQHHFYVYGQRGLLLYSQGSDAQSLNYWYNDAADMIAVHDAFSSSGEKIFYAQGSQHVRLVVSQDGERRQYRYRRTHFGDAIKIISEQRTGDGLLRMRYWLQAMPEGQEWLQRKVVERDGVVIDTQLTRLGHPLRIEREGEVTSFVYASPHEYLIQKTTPYETVKLSYDGKHHKINRVERDVVGGEISWSRFSYDAQGHLQHAENSEGMSVDLTYGHEGFAKGEIVKMVSDKHTVSFVYNETGQPVRIQLASVGEIRVTYDDHGEILSVETGEGDNDHRLALEITTMFQRFLSIVQPAGVSLMKN